MESKHFDVVVVGAGISGIGAGYYLQTKSPNKDWYEEVVNTHFTSLIRKKWKYYSTKKFLYIDA